VAAARDMRKVIVSELQLLDESGKPPGSRREDRWDGLEHMAGSCPTSTMPHELLGGAARC
jgi:hypothetical protein